MYSQVSNYPVSQIYGKRFCKVSALQISLTECQQKSNRSCSVYPYNRLHSFKNGIYTAEILLGLFPPQIRRRITVDRFLPA